MAKVWASGWCERVREYVLSVGYLRHRERGVVCDRVGMDQQRTRCAGLNSLTGNTTERPQCSVQLSSFSPFSPLHYFSSPFALLISSPCRLVSSSPTSFRLPPSSLFFWLVFWQLLSSSLILIPCLASPLLSSLEDSSQVPADKMQRACQTDTGTLTKVLTFLRAAQMSTHLMKKSPEECNTTYLQGCFESSEATSETSAAKPIRL